MSYKDVVLTGIGVLTPIGNDLPSYWSALCEGRTGIGVLQSLPTAFENLHRIGGEVADFKAKDFVQPRKNLKVMTRDIQLGFVAAALACRDAGLTTTGEGDRTVEPERIGVTFGADLIGAEVDALLDAFKFCINDHKVEFDRWGEGMKSIFPLWMLKHLPNMPACHIGIALDARGPSNTVMVSRGSCIAAIAEGVRAIQRGIADVMVCGSIGNRINPDFMARGRSYDLAPHGSDPDTVPRPFDADRCGSVLSEGAGVYILESRDFAQARGARIRAKISGFAATSEAADFHDKPTGEGIRRAIRQALAMAERAPEDLAHVNADGMGTVDGDRIEAEAIRAELGDVPVMSLKGAVGDTGAGAGAIELAASVLALEHGQVPPTRNCDKPAADCPVNVVHGKPLSTNGKKVALKLNQVFMARSYALVVESIE